MPMITSSTPAQPARLKVRRSYILKGRGGQPDELVWVTAAVPTTVGVKGSLEFPERTEIWYAFRAAGEQSAGLLAHPSSLRAIEPEAR